MERMNDLWRCRTPQGVAAVQTDLLRDALGSALERGRRMADLSLKLVDDAKERLAQDIKRQEAA